MARTQAKFSPEFLFAFKHFQETQNKAGMRAFLESHLDSFQPSRKPKPNSKIAFAFDIDGVLIRGGIPLPGAKATLEFLQRQKIPFIFLTNGGGATEKDHVTLHGGRLSMTNLSEHQFVQSHSPFKDLVHSLKEKNILILGGVGNKLREVAKSYGFNHVLTSSDICKADPKAYLFTEYTLDRHLEHGSDVIRRGPKGEIQISAIMVWSSPRDWALDLQVIVDLLLSEKGILNTVSQYNGDVKLPNRGYLQDEQPAIYFSNPDLTLATAHPHPRAAQGSFRAALEGLFASRTAGAHLLNVKTVGKPTEATYAFSEKTLMKWSRSIDGGDGKIGTVYMIGDNPASDIQGANNFRSRHGTVWKSILVESGVHVAGTKPAHEPKVIVKGVKEAVEWALLDSKLSDLGHIPDDSAGSGSS